MGDKPMHRASEGEGLRVIWAHMSLLRSGTTQPQSSPKLCSHRPGRTSTTTAVGTERNTLELPETTARQGPGRRAVPLLPDHSQNHPLKSLGHLEHPGKMLNASVQLGSSTTSCGCGCAPGHCNNQHQSQLSLSCHDEPSSPESPRPNTSSPKGGHSAKEAAGQCQDGRTGIQGIRSSPCHAQSHTACLI